MESRSLDCKVPSSSVVSSVTTCRAVGRSSTVLQGSVVCVIYKTWRYISKKIIIRHRHPFIANLAFTMTGTRLPNSCLTFTAFCAWLVLLVPVLARNLSLKLSKELSPKLSHGASLSTKAPQRWSDYNDPNPAVVVNVGNEADVALTVSISTHSKDRY